MKKGTCVSVDNQCVATHCSFCDRHQKTGGGNTQRPRFGSSIFPWLIVLSIFGSLATGCIGPTNAPSYQPVPEQQSDMCTWLTQALVLRKQLISNASEFTAWYQARGQSVLLLGSFSELDDLVPILANAQAVQDQFIDDWVELGSHPEAREYWEQQLLSIRLRNRAFETMIDGIGKRDRTNYESGFEFWEQAGQVGLQAESLERQLQSSCR